MLFSVSFLVLKFIKIWFFVTKAEYAIPEDDVTVEVMGGIWDDCWLEEKEVNEPNCLLLIESVFVIELFLYCAVIETDLSEFVVDVFIWKFTLLELNGIKIDDGICTKVESDVERKTVTPPTGAIFFNVTMPVELLPPNKTDGITWKLWIGKSAVILSFIFFHSLFGLLKIIFFISKL